MLKDIKKLADIASADARTIIGLMSGTSLDGLDVALCKVHSAGHQTKVELLKFATVPYDESYRNHIDAVFSKRDVDLELVTLLHPLVGTIHARLVNQQLREWAVDADDVDLIASHGQTIYHAPISLHKKDHFPNATLQLGDGDHLAVETGIITISDFRQKHIAAGGEGAPLAAYGDCLIFGDTSEDRILLNIGGIANITYLPKSLAIEHVFSTDVGPGNTLMDAYVRRHFPGKLYDSDAAIARSGTVDESLLHQLKSAEFFPMGFPKTTGPELFNLDFLQSGLQRAGAPALSHQDIVATLNRLTAETIAEAISTCTSTLPNAVSSSNATIFASGGGVHNPLLMQSIQSLLPQHRIKSTSELHIDPDAKEAVLFAVLANECVAGQETHISNLHAGIPGVSMGKVSICH